MHCHNPPHPECEAFHAHLHPGHVLKKCRILPGYHGLLSGERHRFKPAGQGRPDTMQRLCVQDHGLACTNPSAVCTPPFKRIWLLVCLAYSCLCGEKGMAMDALDGKTPAASAHAEHPSAQCNTSDDCKPCSTLALLRVLVSLCSAVTRILCRLGTHCIKDSIHNCTAAGKMQCHHHTKGSTLYLTRFL